MIVYLIGMATGAFLMWCWLDSKADRNWMKEHDQ